MGDVVLMIPPRQRAEVAVLAKILSLKPESEELIDQLKPANFREPAHVVIFDAIQSLARDKTPIDIMRVSDWLRQFGDLGKAGGFSYLFSLGTCTYQNDDMAEIIRLLK